MPTDQGDVATPQPARHSAVANVLQFFAYQHLPAHLQATSKRFYNPKLPKGYKERFCKQVYP